MDNLLLFIRKRERKNNQLPSNTKNMLTNGQNIKYDWPLNSEVC